MRAPSGESSSALPTRNPTPPEAAIRSVTPVVIAPRPRTSADWSAPRGVVTSTIDSASAGGVARFGFAGRFPEFRAMPAR